MTQQLNLKPGRKSISSPKVRASNPVKRRKRLPLWASLLIAGNGMVLLAVSILTTQPELTKRLMNNPRISPLIAKVWPNAIPSVEPVAPIVEVAPTEVARTVLSYDQWLDVLKQEAVAVSAKNPERLTVLLGDSLSLWFPPEQLPSDRSWLNQGMSGETTAAMLKRLNFLDETKPQTILVMAGINDLKSGVSDSDLLTNYRTMVQTLKQKHPDSELIIQSILPHSGESMTVEERDRLLAVSNEQIFKLNQKLATMAKEEQVLFLNLNPLFSNNEGMLRSDLTTDGLHLSPAGYLVWSTAFQTFSQTQLRGAVSIPSGTPQAETPQANADKPVVDQPQTP
jgi:lysophospholipase L1-like esterase